MKTLEDKTKLKTKVKFYLTFNFWQKLSIKVIILFIATMLFSFPTETEMFRGFFGDYWEQKYSSFPAELKWGWRHYLYNAMGGVLFLIQTIRIIFWIDEQNNIKSDL